MSLKSLIIYIQQQRRRWRPFSNRAHNGLYALPSIALSLPRCLTDSLWLAGWLWHFWLRTLLNRSSSCLGFGRRSLALLAAWRTEITAWGAALSVRFSLSRCHSSRMVGRSRSGQGQAEEQPPLAMTATFNSQGERRNAKTFLSDWDCLIQ